MSRNSFIEGLESRTFLSVTPLPVLFDSPVVRDRAAIKSDLLKFTADVARNAAKLSNDLHKIKKDTPAGDTTLDASVAQLKADGATLKSELTNDRLTEQANALADESTIKLDILKIRKDKGKSTDETTDHAKLAMDRITLQTDLLAGLDSRITTRQGFETTIANDTQAIVTANMNDTSSTTKLTEAITKFAADRVTCLDKLTGDLQTIATARQKLANDLAAQTS